MTAAMTCRQPCGRRTLTATLTALAVMLLLHATTASAAHRRARPRAGAESAAARVAPFKMSFSAQTIVGAPNETHLTRIVILQAAPGDRLVMECRHCRGGGQWSTQARGGKTVFSVSHLILTERSSLIVYVTKSGSIGRYKEYTLSPRRRSHHLIHQGCLAIDVYVRISCSASGRVDVPIGPGAVIPDATPSCPGTPCLVIARTTGFQVSLGGQIPVSATDLKGSITSWRIALGAPASNQISYMEATEGGPAQAGISILRPQPSSGGHTYVPVAQSPLVALEPYFGTAARFLLAAALPVERGDVIALTTPTWAPALATSMGSDATWRASRPSSQCSDAGEQTAAKQLGVSVEFGCLYGTVTLTYSATLSTGV